MPFQTAIQSLISNYSPQTGHTGFAAPDWVNGLLYEWGPTPATGYYLSKFNIGTGAELAHMPASTYPNANNLGALGPTGLWMMSLLSQDILQVDPVTLALLSTGGAARAYVDGTLSAITNTSSQNWLLYTEGGFSIGRNFGCLNAATYADWTPGDVSFVNALAYSCAGPKNTGLGYVVSSPDLGTTSPLLVWKVNTNTGVQAATQIATVNPTNIDAGWTQITTGGLCLDQTDNNLLLFAQGQSGATNQYYMFKMNANTGSIIWKLVVSGPGGGQQAAESNIEAQQYCLISELGGGLNRCEVIDTNAGAITSSFTTGLAGTLPYSSQCFNDQTGAVVGEFAYTAGVGAPIQLNSTPASFSGWAAVYVVPPKPVFSAILGNGYFIERMDNREWPAVENVWCVDCALQTTLPTFNATLTASSATGAGVPTGVTGLFGGQGYSAGTTATILDPTGSGAGVSLTIASGIITGITIVGGTGYTYPQLEFSDPAQTGQGASAEVTLDNSAIFQTSAAVFNSGMVGDVIRMGGGIATITHYTGTQQVTANITTPIAQVLPNSGGIPAPQTAGNWSIATPTSVVYGLWHLIGFTVTGVADGNVVTPRVVQSNGSVILDAPATLITLGLPFTPQFQSLYLDGGSPTIQGQRKKVAAVTVRLDASGVTGMVAGSNQPTGSAESPQIQDVLWLGLDGLQTRPDQAVPPYGSTTPPLFTGDTRAALNGGVDRPGQVALQQNLPLPMNITAIIPEGLEGDQPEQGYQPKPEREPRRPSPKGGGRGRG